MFSSKKFIDASCLVCFIVLCLGSAILADAGAPSSNSTITKTAPSLPNSTPESTPSNNATRSKAPHVSSNLNSSSSEAADMTSSQKYTGGSDVDEIRPTASSRAHKHSHLPPMHAEISASEDNGLLEDLSQPSREKLRTDRFNPTFAAIVAAICITTAVGGYILLMAWQRVEMPLAFKSRDEYWIAIVILGNRSIWNFRKTYH
ncbi:unnamed protein product [Nesidiocoris tenuis]|uniref:Uncharacterized protein n=1 Tax=Nesidiocoris tenuis TaxID=355587 RepID=A0A6H5GI09_9HEMI|nr:unnamed protein product [Nesidiocoris tenuis]